MLQLLDYFYTFLHSAIILIILFGWIHPKSRKLHLIVLALTLTAWLLIGWYLGSLGYCPLTDWHWDVKRSLGEKNLPNSFTKYMIDRILIMDIDKHLVDWITSIGLGFGVLMGVIMKVRIKQRIS